jgi:hypothetical protein
VAGAGSDEANQSGVRSCEVAFRLYFAFSGFLVAHLAGESLQLGCVSNGWTNFQRPRLSLLRRDGLNHVWLGTEKPEQVDLCSFSRKSLDTRDERY